jgi:osmotically-inducible protein OsmY
MPKARVFDLIGFRVAALVLAAASLALSTGCMSTRTAGEQMDDAAIQSEIKAQLAADGDTNPFEIEVDSNEGVVRLSGSVENAGDRDKAVQIAQGVEGVRRVINEIKIGDPTVSEVIDDKLISTKIKAKLTAHPEINPFNIDVDTQDGVVTLSGRVAKMLAKEEAERLARETDGVKQVNNRISVGDEG